MSKFNFKIESNGKGILDLSGRNVDSLQEIIDLLSNEELKNIERLLLANNNITSLKGIDKFPNIHEINLENNKIEEITEQDLEWINNFSFMWAKYQRDSYYEFIFQILLKGNPIVNLDFLNKIEYKKIFKTFNGIWTVTVREHDKHIMLGNTYGGTLKKGVSQGLEYNSYKVYVNINVTGKNHVQNKIAHPYWKLYWSIVQDEKGVKKSLEEYCQENGCSHEEAQNALSELAKNASMVRSAVEKEKSKGPCFIATATMGSYDHPTVLELRIFRDELLMPKKWGRAFVSFYYQYGPIPARFIENSQVLKTISYALIVKPLHLISKLLRK
jgi:hypothetical protein